MSNVPHYAFLRSGTKVGDIKLTDGMTKDGLWDVYNDFHMGSAAELGIKKYGHTRQQLDECALCSYKKAQEATAKGKFKNEVVAIAPGVDRLVSASGAFSTTSSAYTVSAVGQPWGQMFGGGIKRDSVSGQPILTSAGLFIRQDDVNFGSVLPDYTGGVQNTFTLFKNFTVNINIDYQYGGKFFSLSDFWGTFSGLTARTATLIEIKSILFYFRIIRARNFFGFCFINIHLFNIPFIIKKDKIFIWTICTIYSHQLSSFVNKKILVTSEDFNLFLKPFFHFTPPTFFGWRHIYRFLFHRRR